MRVQGNQTKPLKPLSQGFLELTGGSLYIMVRLGGLKVESKRCQRAGGAACIVTIHMMSHCGYYSVG